MVLKEVIFVLNPTRLKVYILAYLLRCGNGEKIEDIDKEYKEKKNLTDEDLNQIHDKLDF